MKKIIIIGGGIAGLSAGIHARQYGFESVIYEKHSIVGGQCTGWDRKGYHVDGCIHWLTGTREGTELYDLWENVGALGNVEIIQQDCFGTYEIDGVTVNLWKDLNRFQRELTELAPEDTKVIEKMIREIRTLQTMDTPSSMPLSMMTWKEKVKTVKATVKPMLFLGKLLKTGCGDYGKRFQSPILRTLFTMILPDNYSILAFSYGMAEFSSGNGAIPKGGSRAMALRMEQRYKELGGKVFCNSSAEEIMIENGEVKAVRLADGTIEKADYIIAACDAKVTFDHLLQGRYQDRKYEMRYSNPGDYPLPTSVQVAFGVEEDLSSYPYTLVFPVEPFQIGTVRQPTMSICNYSYDKDFASEGNTVVITTANQSEEDYLYWEKLYQDKEAYRKEKQRIAEEYLSRFIKRFPELAGKVHVLDVATPITYHRYTGAYHGAWMSFMMTTKSKYMSHPGIIKGLKNCYLTGQWLTPPGGLPIAVTSGKYTVLRIARAEKMKLK